MVNQHEQCECNLLEIERDANGSDQIFPALNEIDIAVKRLAKWMKDEGGWWDSTLAFSTFSGSSPCLTDYSLRRSEY